MTTTESPPTRVVAEMEGELTDIERRISVTKREVALLARKIETESRAQERWTKLATTAMRAGDDVVAKDALARGRACDRTLGALRAGLASKTEELRGLGATRSAVTFRLEQVHATLAVAARTSKPPSAPSLPALSAPFKPLAKASLAAPKRPLAKAVSSSAATLARTRESASPRDRRTKR